MRESKTATGAKTGFSINDYTSDYSENEQMNQFASYTNQGRFSDDSSDNATYQASNQYYNASKSNSLKEKDNYMEAFKQGNVMRIRDLTPTDNPLSEITEKTGKSLMDLLYRLFFNNEETVRQKNSETKSKSNSEPSHSVYIPADSLTAVNTIKGIYQTDQKVLWKQETRASVFTEAQETTNFSSTGYAKTADGRTLSFNVNVEMSSQFMEHTTEITNRMYTAALTDPLVINLDSSPAEISDQKFYFDLDCDGDKEQISQMTSSHGFLALDRNNDGKINDGSELFGTRSGNGFADLASYDQDGNGWIDEADAIYQNLKVWTKDENGKDRLMTLKEADVGAINLNQTQTDFSLKSGMHNLDAQVRATGVYLHENGTAGTIQQVDF